MWCIFPAFRKCSLIAMKHTFIHLCYKRTNEIIFNGLFLGIFKDTPAQSLFLSCSKSSSSQVLAFQLNGCIPGCNSKKQLATAFLKEIVFFKILFNQFVAVKELLGQSSLKINSLNVMLLRTTQFVCEINRTSMYLSEYIVTSTFIFRQLFRGCFYNKVLLFQRATSDKFSTNKGLSDHALQAS